MDGIVALLLSKKFTKDTVIGMGAIKGAPCQVQSIDKVDKTTTITLKWEDNVGGVHTQAFDVEDGEDGISVVDATITANGHLELTLSDGNDIDCGKVLPQYDTMPPADATTLGAIYQYIGATDASYTNGYFYECVYEGGSYKWVKKLVQDSYTKIEIGDLTNLPDNTKNVVENIVDINNKIDDKENIFRYNVIPTASVDISGAIIQYLGSTNATYTNGYYYQCVESPVGSGTYVWVQKNVQPNNGGGGGDGVVDGYYNSLDQLFYEDSAFLNPITGEDNTIYVDLNTNGLYRYNGTIFIKVSSSAESIQVDTMPTADASQLNKIYQYVGTTDINYTNGYFYKCILDGVNYKWQVIPTQDSYTKAEIGALSDLPDPSKNVIQNIDLLQGSMSTLQGSVLNIKNDVTNLQGSVLNIQTDVSALQGSMAGIDKTKLDNLAPIYLIGSGLTLDTTVGSPTYGKLQATGMSIPVDDKLDASSLNPVQNKVITLTIDQLQGSVLNKIQKMLGAQEDNFAIIDNDGGVKDSGISKDVVPITASASNKLLVASDLSVKADKVSGAINDDFATLDSNGNIKDSGINKNIIPTTATSSNKLATIADIPDELNDLDDVVITSPVNKQILAYNSTSGKWENQTGQETIGGIVPKGSILFANLPTTGMSNGDAYDIKDAFVTDNRFEEGSGIECGAGTDVVWIADENKWNILTPSGVYSFNGRTGAVLPATSDYDADQVDYDNTTSGLTATDVQAAIDEVASEKADKVSSATSGHLAGLDGNGNLTDSGVVANDVIQKVATATGLLKDDGTVDTTSYAPSANAYLVGDTAETIIDDTDYFPFYDTSATGKRKTLWSNIKAKLKTYFDGLYATILPASSPTPTEASVVSDINGVSASTTKAASAYALQQYSNEKKVRRVLNGANIPSGTSMTATGIGTWTDKAIDQITSADETDWWYDSAFVVPVYYMLTSDTSIVTGKTYYTRSGTAPNYTYTVVASPVIADIGTYYEQYSDDVDISIKFDPSGDTATLGGYIFDSTTGKICIKFGNNITVNTARIAVDITYTRNEVG